MTTACQAKARRARFFPGLSRAGKAQARGLSSAAFPGTLQRDCIRDAAAGAGVGACLGCCTTMPAPEPSCYFSFNVLHLNLVCPGIFLIPAVSFLVSSLGGNAVTVLLAMPRRLELIFSFSEESRVIRSLRMASHGMGGINYCL